MNKEKICWCLMQKKGISLITPAPHLSESYIQEADETLENVFVAKGKWKVITAYYACYSAVYAILMKCGIKSEIHDCTIELLSLFDFTREEIDFINQLKHNRIQAQYYLKDLKLDNENEVKKFVSRCKILLNSLNSKKIEEVRNTIKQLKML